MYFILIHVVDRLQPAHQIIGRQIRIGVRIRRIITQVFVFDDQSDHVHAETIDAALEPETQRLQHRRAQRRIAPIQIGLLFYKLMQVILACRVVQRPRRAAEETAPIVGR